VGDHRWPITRHRLSQIWIRDTSISVEGHLCVCIPLITRGGIPVLLCQCFHISPGDDYPVGTRLPSHYRKELNSLQTFVVLNLKIMIEVWTDGSCLGNPGPGGWGVIFVENNTIIKEMSGSEGLTTNNRMELEAMIKALESVPPSTEERITIFSDSKYVIDGIARLESWKKRGWKNVKNLDRWFRLIEAMKNKNVEFTWVKAHNATYYNEYVDRLARAEATIIRDRGQL
jgi:ribonuclease HI